MYVHIYIYICMKLDEISWISKEFSKYVMVNINNMNIVNSSNNKICSINDITITTG